MKLTALAKFVDQPLIINKISNNAPKILGGAAIALGVRDVFLKKNKSKESKSSRLLKNFVVLSSVAGASLLASRGMKINGKQIFNGLIENVPKNLILKKQRKVIDSFVAQSNSQDVTLLKMLDKAKDKPLNLRETSYVVNKLAKDNKAEALMSTLFGEKKDLTSKEIFSEIGRLSLLGLVPVVAGVGAGCAVDKSINKRKNNTNRIKEGFYQYFANIFLCNVGAGAALFGLEVLKKKKIIKQLTPAKKFTAMIVGIASTGVVGGSFIANYLSKKIIDPIILKKKEKLSFNKIYDERKPESLDMAMHIDDVATAGVLSGLKWIEPVLPVFYLFSGYRAGIGYRNGIEK